MCALPKTMSKLGTCVAIPGLAWWWPSLCLPTEG